MGKRCAVLRLDAIGDFVLWIDSANALIQYQLECGNDVTVYCRKSTESIAERFLNNPNRIRIAALDGEVKDVVKQIQSADIAYDTVIQCVYNNTEYIDCVVSAFKAKEKISMKGSMEVYSHIIPIADEWQHEYLKNITFTESIIHRDIIIPVHRRKNEAEEYFTVSPFASMEKKSLSIEKYAMIIKWILNASDLNCVCLGLSSERTAIESMINEIGIDRCVNKAGETSMEEYWELISKAAFVIGNDSSCIHIAAFCGVPSICIAGGQHWGRFFPYDEKLAQYFETPLIASHKLRCFRCNFQRNKRTLSCLASKYQKKKFPCIELIDVSEIESYIATLI